MHRESFFEIVNISVNYGVIKALTNISVKISEGEIISIIGANGAGKSTLLKSITGIAKVNDGNILFQSQDITNKPPEEIVKKGIAMVPEGRRVFSTLTVKENLELGAYFIKDKKIIKENYELVLRTFPRIEERLSQPAGTLSGGEQQMLAIGRALMSNPKLLLLDEPSMGLSPKITSEIFQLIEKINKERGISIIMVEQNALMALKTSKRGYVIENGKIVLEGSSGELLQNPQIIKAYLGA
ncbi:MAG: ABC transporter ATP-binding protein [Proteobacteria bacterium]|nr:ABC transporter ATP-binding protein [Pseudomonadota bacterium]